MIICINVWRAAVFNCVSLVLYIYYLKYYYYYRGAVEKYAIVKENHGLAGTSINSSFNWFILVQ